MDNSTKGSMEAVEQRLEKLEKANRRLTWIALAFGAGLVLIFALAATEVTKPVTVVGREKTFLQTQRLEIVGTDGIPRIVLGTGGDSEFPFIALKDADHCCRFSMTALPEGGMLVELADKDRTREATFGIISNMLQLKMGKRDGVPFLFYAEKDGAFAPLDFNSVPIGEVVGDHRGGFGGGHN